MRQIRNVTLASAAVAILVAIGLGIAWAIVSNETTRQTWHILHVLIALKILKWVAAGVLLAWLAIRRLVKRRGRGTPADRTDAAVVRLPGGAP